MDNDPEIHREDFYENVLQELEIDGQLFQMPVDWNYFALYFNLNMTYDLGVDVRDLFPDGVNYKQVVDLFTKMQEAGIVTDETFFAPNQSAAFLDETVMADFFDLETNTCSFDSPVFIDYLETVDRLPWDHTLREGMDYGAIWISFAPSDYFCNRYIVTATAQLEQHRFNRSLIFPIIKVQSKTTFSLKPLLSNAEFISEFSIFYHPSIYIFIKIL